MIMLIVCFFFLELSFAWNWSQIKFVKKIKEIYFHKKNIYRDSPYLSVSDLNKELTKFV